MSSESDFDLPIVKKKLFTSFTLGADTSCARMKPVVENDFQRVTLQKTVEY